jgi:hypothetical protein
VFPQSWPPIAIAAIVGIGIIVLGGFIFLGFGLGNDGLLEQLQHAPALDLTFLDGTLLDTQTVGSMQGVGAYRLHIFGTDASSDAIVSYYDAALRQAGYTQTAPTPDRQFTGQESRLLRQYQNGAFTYRLYLLPLPQRVRGNWVMDGYAHLLYAKVNN